MVGDGGAEGPSIIFVLNMIASSKLQSIQLRVQNEKLTLFELFHRDAYTKTLRCNSKI